MKFVTGKDNSEQSDSSPEDESNITSDSLFQQPVDSDGWLYLSPEELDQEMTSRVFQEAAGEDTLCALFLELLTKDD